MYSYNVHVKMSAHGSVLILFTSSEPSLYQPCACVFSDVINLLIKAENYVRNIATQGVSQSLANLIIHNIHLAKLGVWFELFNSIRKNVLPVIGPLNNIWPNSLHGHIKHHGRIVLPPPVANILTYSGWQVEVEPN